MLRDADVGTSICFRGQVNEVVAESKSNRLDPRIRQIGLKEKGSIFDSFYDDAPFARDIKTTKHCVPHVDNLMTRLVTRHYWCMPPAVLVSVVKHFKTKDYGVFGTTACNKPDHSTQKFRRHAPCLRAQGLDVELKG